MAPIVAPGIVRYSAVGTLGDRPWANVLDVRVSPAPGDRTDAVRAVARRVFDAYATLRPRLVSAWKLTAIRWVDLDSLSGTTGEVTTGDATTVPVAGTGAHGDPLPGNVALLVKKNATGGRTARNGRLYICGLGEQVVAGNALVSTEVAPWQAAMDTFLTTLNDPEGDDLTSTNELVVLHAAGGIYESADEVTALTVDSRLATQRRRLRG